VIEHVLTEAHRRADHLGDLGVEVAVHEPDAGVLSLQVADPPPEQLVVVAGQVVEALEAAVPVVVALVGAPVQCQVQRKAPDRQHARHHHLHRAQPNQCLCYQRVRSQLLVYVCSEVFRNCTSTLLVILSTICGT
jgi:hypothetical protein